LTGGFFAITRLAGAFARALPGFAFAPRFAGLRAAAFARFVALRAFAGFLAFVPLRLPRAIMLLLLSADG